MPYVARTKGARARMRGPSSRELTTRTLRCGHITYMEPVASGRIRLFRCPDGCGLQEAA